MLKIAVGFDVNGWHAGFADELEQKRRAGWDLAYELVDLDASDWVRAIGDADLVLWKSAYMGTQGASLFKEKIYFIEHFLGRLVVPNFASVWHFESKVAQSFLFAHFDVPTPATFTSQSWKESAERLASEPLPIVMKRPHGSGGRGVRLYADRPRAKAEIDSLLHQRRWEDLKEVHRPGALLAAIRERWLWKRIGQRVLRNSMDRGRYGVVYWQEYLPGNDGDLRVVVIGDSTAFAFWRRNRPGDFRASGSGDIDYSREVPLDVVRYCVDLNRRLDFDSMAYDILFKDGRFLITEMSCTYPDATIKDLAGHYVLSEAGDLELVSGRMAPQQAWVEWALQRAQSGLSSRETTELGGDGPASV